MRDFEVPLKEHYWSQKYCVDVHNIASSKNSNGGFPLKLVKDILRTFQNSDFICGSPFGILRIIRPHKIIGNQHYRWCLHTPPEMKCDTTLIHSRKIQMTSSYQSS